MTTKPTSGPSATAVDLKALQRQAAWARAVIASGVSILVAGFSFAVYLSATYATRVELGAHIDRPGHEKALEASRELTATITRLQATQSHIERSASETAQVVRRLADRVSRVEGQLGRGR